MSSQGIFDKVKDFIRGNPDKVDQGLDKAREVLDERTGGRYSEQIDRGDSMVRERLGVPADSDTTPAPDTPPPAPEPSTVPDPVPPPGEPSPMPGTAPEPPTVPSPTGPGTPPAPSPDPVPTSPPEPVPEASPETTQPHT